MEQNMSDLEIHIVKEFASEDKDDTGEISVNKAEQCLARCKKLNLTVL